MKQVWQAKLVSNEVPPARGRDRIVQHFEPGSSTAVPLNVTYRLGKIRELGLTNYGMWSAVKTSRFAPRALFGRCWKYIPGSPTPQSADIGILFRYLRRSPSSAASESPFFLLHRSDELYCDLPTCVVPKQLYRFGTGFTAYLTRSLLVNPRLILDLVVKLPGALFFALSRKPVPHRAQSINYPKELDRAEMRGMLRGPLTYFQSLWALRGMRRAKR